MTRERSWAQYIRESCRTQVQSIDNYVVIKDYYIGYRNVWSEYYEKLLNEEFDWRRDKLDKVGP